MKIVTVLLWVFIALVGISLVTLPVMSKYTGVSVCDHLAEYLSAVVTYLMAIIALLTLQQNSKLVLYQSQVSNYKQLMQSIGELDVAMMSDLRAKGIGCTTLDEYKEAQICFYSAMSKLREAENHVCVFMNEEQLVIFNKLCKPYIDDVLDEMICFEALIAIMDIVNKQEHELTEDEVIQILSSPKLQTHRALELNELMRISLESIFDVFKKNIALFTSKLVVREDILHKDYIIGLRLIEKNAKDYINRTVI